MDNINLQTKKIFLYARKSTDEPERQVLSIEAQLFELREYAKKEELNIVREFVESKTTKESGREIFNEMVECIEKHEAEGILAWHPDRLARNSIDGGQIIYLVDTGKIITLKFPTFWFDPTPQGKFMLSIAFGQSKYKEKIKKVSLSSAWANASINYFENEKMKIAQAESSFAQKVRNELVEIETKLDRLLDLQLEY
jgi:DNA invertase Pin-like site-specific DNA recombinase